MKNRDKKERNGSSKNIMKQVLNHIGKYKFYLAFSIVMAAVSVVLTLYIPILTGQAVDCIVGAGAVDFDGIWEILKTMVVIILLTAVVQWLMNTSNNKIAYQVVRDVRDEAFRKLEILPLKYIDGHSHGDIVSRIIVGLYTIVYRCCNNCWHAVIYAFDQCADDDCCCDIDTIVIFYSGIYCKTHIQYVKAAIGNKGRADSTD